MPQLVLACCTALVVGEGVKTEGIFKEVAPVDEVERMSALVGGWWLGGFHKQRGSRGGLA